MVAPHVVSAVVHRARLVAAQRRLSTYFEITTNGQFEAKWAAFLGNYSDSVVMSLDGQQEVQDLQRPRESGSGSFDTAHRTASILRDSGAELSLRCCVSQFNVAHMSDIARWFCTEFDPTCISFEVMQPSPRARRNKLSPPGPYHFAAGFLKARLLAAKFGVKVVYAADISAPRWSSCPVGKDALIVSPDNAVSGCYLTPDRWQKVGLDLDFGRVKDLFELDQTAIQSVRSATRKKPRCETCFCRWSCAGGCHVDNTPPGASLEYSDFCRQTRMISWATLLSELIPQRELERVIDDEAMMNSLATRSSDLLTDCDLSDE